MHHLARPYADLHLGNAIKPINILGRERRKQMGNHNISITSKNSNLINIKVFHTDVSVLAATLLTILFCPINAKHSPNLLTGKGQHPIWHFHAA